MVFQALALLAAPAAVAEHLAVILSEATRNLDRAIKAEMAKFLLAAAAAAALVRLEQMDRAAAAVLEQYLQFLEQV